MLDSAPEEIVVLLALLPLHSLTLLLIPHLACGLGLGPAGPLEGGQLLCVAADLVVGDGLGGVEVIRLNLLGHNLVNQFAVCPM